MAPTELNSEGCDADPEGSCSKPLEIDLNETPVCSPGEIVAPAEKSLAGVGGGRAGLLDINALPPSEEETIELVNSRVHAEGDSTIYSSDNAPEKCSNVLYEWNQLNVPKLPGSMTGLVKSGFENIVEQKMIFGRNLKETYPSSVVRERLWAADTSTHRVSYQNYHALDGNRFDSKFDVPSHIGLVSNSHSLETQNRSDGFALMQKGLHFSQIRKESLLSSRVNKECPESLNSNFGGEFSIGIETKESQAYKLKSNLRVTPANSEVIGGCDPLQVGLPFQFEDFCVLAVGEVDPRPFYHSSSQIWPVGYRCSWHDKITGSLFVSEVTDGGDIGPLFKVKRYPCFAQPIPIGSTVLLRPSFNSSDGKCRVDTDDTDRLDDDEYTNIQMLISDDSPPHLECNILSDFGNDFDEAYASETKNSLQTKSNCTSHPGRPATTYIELEDDIGEFLVEARSSSSVWRMVSQTLVHACHKAYEQTGVCKFCCKHDLLRMWSSCFVSVSEEATENSDSLDKFCCSSGPINIPHLIRNNDELDTSCKALAKWLDQDRFGLDVGFVQEIIEQHPRAYICAEYISLNKRSHKSISQTVGSGFLRVTRKGHLHEKEADGSPLRGCERPREQVVENPVMKPCFPPGKPLSSKLPTELICDVFQSWEFLWRFSEVLGLEEPLSFKELEEDLIYGHSSTLRSSSSTVPQENEHACVAMETESLREAAHVQQGSNTNSGCSDAALVNVLCSLLKILLGELQSKVSTFVDSNFDGGETKSRRRRKKDVDNSMSAKKVMLDLLPINGLTWPELARRYVLTVSSMEGNLDFVDFTNHENGKAFHCLQGDGRTIRGSLPGVAGMEADALLLAEATKRIFGALKSKNDISSVEYNESDVMVGHRTVKVDDNGIPEWAQVLEPVRKLPTNVGARIRKCVYEALNKHPPEWAKKRLEHSICKEVYKGNASGPTKKAVLSVLADVCGETQQQKPNRKRKNRCFSSVSDVIMKQCRKVLRCAAAADEEKVFCNLLGRTLLHTYDNDDEGLLGFPAMVSRPLDFRTIDLRLAFGAYCGSHEAFLEDVREVWHHIRTAYSDQSELLELAEKLSQDFEVLYEKEVLSLVQKFSNYPNIDSLNSEAKKEIEEIFESASEIPKAPWDEGVCKVCGIDKDDDNVLLCDTCDSGYHTYCLTPPLARVPEGNWYCPSCVTGHCNNQYITQVPQVISSSQKKRYHGEFSRGFMESLSHLATTMEMRDYWEYTARERIFLLKFLCDALLNSPDIRENLEQCASVSVDLQQKLRSLYLEWRNLKFKEETIIGKVARANSSVGGGAGKSGSEGASGVRTNNRKSMRQPPRGSSHVSSLPSALALPEDPLQWHGENDSRKQPYLVYSKGNSMKHPSYNGNQGGGAPCTDFQLHQLDSAGELLDGSNLNREQELQKGVKNGSVLPSCEISQSHISSNTDRSHVADEHICANNVNCESQLPDRHGIVQPDTNESQTPDIGSELKNLQDSIACLESQLLAVSLRKEPLGRDSVGRLYWVFSRPGTSPWLVVDGTTLIQQGNVTKEHRDPLAKNSTLKCSPFETENKGIPTSSSWFSYQSDAEIEELVEWLTDSDAKERELAESILRWRRIGYKDSIEAGNFVQDESLPSPSNRINSGTTINTNGLITNALAALEKKHGPCLELEASKIPTRQCRIAELTCTERMYRCQCLEPVWPSRCHCFGCHQSFLSRHELEEHNDGLCNLGASASQNSKANDSGAKEKGMTGNIKLLGECISGRVQHETGGWFEFSKESACPYDIDEISAKFVTQSSIKELIQEIGLIGSNGIPSFVPNASPYLSDPALKLVSLCKNDVNRGDESSDLENRLKYPVQGNKNSCMKHDSISNNSIRRCFLNGNDEEVVKIRRLNPTFVKLGIGNDSSLRPLMGKSIQILRQLKINLLDMDAAVPEEALRSSKACWGKRCAWRAFVKSAKTIFEMVQATIVFEDMIKTDYLRNGWWYWSSLSAAANIGTVSSLAHRMYTLDAAIVYERPPAVPASTEIPDHGCKSDKDISPCKESTNGTKPSKLVPKTPCSDSTDLSKTRSRSARRRKDLVG